MPDKAVVSTKNVKLLDPSLGDRSLEVGWPMGLYSNLDFTPRGLARFWHVVGYLQALRLYKAEVAERLLQLFDEQLQLLNEYGGRLSDNLTPANQVRVHDDGEWGSFAIRIYRGMPPSEVSRIQNNPEFAGLAKGIEPKFDRWMMEADGTTGEARYRELPGAIGLVFHGGTGDQSQGVDIESGHWALHS